jgi:hypothetical protein
MMQLDDRCAVTVSPVFVELKPFLQRFYEMHAGVAAPRRTMDLCRLPIPGRSACVAHRRI